MDYYKCLLSTGKDDSNKRVLEDSPPSSLGDSAYNFDSGTPANGASLQVKPPIKTFSRPRKFFKSRNTEEAPEPSKSSADKGRGKTSDGLYGVKAPPLASFEMPDSIPGSQRDLGSSKGSVDAGRESVFDKLVTSPTTNKFSNSETVTSSRSGSGIKLKIFKSRNVASCSQETYSSTVELPSDDSHAGSASTSVASSPSTKDLSEENRDSSEELAPSGSPQTEYKEIQQVTLPTLSSGETAYSSPEKDALNRTLDSSFEYNEIIDQRTGLPVDMCNEDRFRVSENKSKSETPQCDAKVTDVSKFSKSGELNKCIRKDLMSTSEIDTQQSVLPSEVCDAPLPDYDVLSMGTSDFAEPQKTPPLEREGSLCVSSSAGDADSENFNLFGTDFDENEIVDRTNIDCSVPGALPLKDEGGLGDTQEMEDFLFSTQGSLDTSQSTATASFESFKPGQQSKSETEGIKKQGQPLVKKRSIFKSRDVDRDAKKRATYTHKWHSHEEKDENAKQHMPVLQNTQSLSGGSTAFDEFDFEMPTSLKRVQTWPGSSAALDDSTEGQSVTSVKCAKSAKQVGLLQCSCVCYGRWLLKHNAVISVSCCFMTVELNFFNKKKNCVQCHLTIQHSRLFSCLCLFNVCENLYLVYLMLPETS